MRKAGSLMQIFIPIIFLGMIYSICLFLFYSRLKKIDTSENVILPVSNTIDPSLKVKSDIFDKIGNAYAAINKGLKSTDDFYGKGIPMKSEYFKVFRFIKLNIFKTNPLPRKLVRGKKAFYFLGDSYSNDILESKGIINFSPLEINRCVTNMLRWQNWLSRKGIKFHIAMAPGKLSAYGQYLPIIKRNQPTKLDQLKDAFNKNHISLIDLKENFPGPFKNRLFDKTDTHWSDYGAFLGYQALMKHAEKETDGGAILRLDDFYLDKSIAFGDMLKMIGLGQIEQILILTPRKGYQGRPVENIYPVPANYKGMPGNYEFRYKNPGRKKKLLVFRDSFFIRVIPFLKENFGESVFLWGHINAEIIAKENPDIVIYELAERDIDVFTIMKKYK